VQNLVYDVGAELNAGCPTHSRGSNE
jgi:hypothetical protein